MDGQICQRADCPHSPCVQTQLSSAISKIFPSTLTTTPPSQKAFLNTKRKKCSSFRLTGCRRPSSRVNGRTGRKLPFPSTPSQTCEMYSKQLFAAAARLAVPCALPSQGSASLCSLHSSGGAPRAEPCAGTAPAPQSCVTAPSRAPSPTAPSCHARDAPDTGQGKELKESCEKNP